MVVFLHFRGACPPACPPKGVDADAKPVIVLSSVIFPSYAEPPGFAITVRSGKSINAICGRLMPISEYHERWKRKPARIGFGV